MQSIPTQYPDSNIPDESKQTLVSLVDSGIALEENREYSRAIGVYRSYLKLDQSNPWIHAHLGECLYLTGSTDDSLASFSKALELDHQYLWAYAGRGRIYFDRMEFALSLLDFQQALALNQDDTWILNHAGECLLALNRFDQAVPYFNQSIGLNPEDKWTLAHRGMALMQSGRLEDSRLDLDAAIRIDADYAWAHFYLAILNGMEEHYDEAEQQFELVLKLSPGFTQVYRERGLMYYRMKEYNRAIQDFDHLSAIFPHNASLYRLIAEANEADGRLDSARENYLKAYRLGDHSPSLQSALGAICIDLKLYDEAMRALNLAIKWSSSELKALVNRAEILRWRGKYTRALNDIDRAIELGPEQPARLWTLRAKINTDKGDRQQALSDYTTALQHDPNYVQALIGRGHLYNRIGCFAEAVDDFSAANMIQSDQVFVLQERAWAYRMLGNQQAAILDLESVSLIDFDIPEALQQLVELLINTYQHKSCLAWLNALIARQPENKQIPLTAAHALANNGLYKEALQFCNRYQLDHPDQAAGYLERAWIYKAMFQFELSQKNIADALQIDPTNPTAYGYRAMIHRNLDQYDEAINDFNRALEINPQLGWVSANRGLVFYESGRPTEANADYQQALKLGYRTAWIWYRIANLHLDQREGKKALQAIEKAMSSSPDSIEGYYLSALAHLELGHPNKVDENLQIAIRVGEEKCRLVWFDIYQRNILAKAYLASGLSEKGLAIVDRILDESEIPQIVSGLLAGYLDLARLMPNSESISEAIERFNHFLKSS